MESRTAALRLSTCSMRASFR
jgi:hypothetical protein